MVLIGFPHKRAPAGLNQWRQTAELCSNVPSSLSIRWVSKQGQDTGAQPTCGTSQIWVYPNHIFPTYPSCYQATQIVCFIYMSFLDICLWDFCHHHNTIGFNWISTEVPTVLKKHLILNMKTRYECDFPEAMSRLLRIIPRHFLRSIL